MLFAQLLSVPMLYINGPSAFRVLPSTHNDTLSARNKKKRNGMLQQSSHGAPKTKYRGPIAVFEKHV